MGEALGLTALMLACIAQFCADHDAGLRLPAHPYRVLDENIWRAQRGGLEGRLIDLDRGVERSARAAVEALLEWSEPVHEPLGLSSFLGHVGRMLAAGNGAMRQLARLEALGDPRAVHAEVVESTRRSAEAALPLAGAVSA
jgi:carboxylate-amine ligase